MYLLVGNTATYAARNERGAVGLAGVIETYRSATFFYPLPNPYLI